MGTKGLSEWLELPLSFQSISFPSEWGLLTESNTNNGMISFQSISFPSEWGPLLLKPLYWLMSRGTLRGGGILGGRESGKGIVEIAGILVGKGSEGVYAIIGVSGISLPPRLQVLNDDGGGGTGEW